MSSKKRPQLFIALVFILTLVGCASTNLYKTVDESSADITVKSKSSPVPVIFDTDMAIDDWLALLFLERSEDINLLAVTVPGSGESRCEPAERNVLSLLELESLDSKVPVACGDEWPLEGYFVFPEAWQVDSDTLSGVSVPPSQKTAYDGHAIELIHETLQASDEPVVILATGTMTNLAQWLEKYPDDKSKVSRVVLMGGAVNVTTRINTPSGIFTLTLWPPKWFWNQDCQSN